MGLAAKSSGGPLYLFLPYLEFRVEFCMFCCNRRNTCNNQRATCPRDYSINTGSPSWFLAIFGQWASLLCLTRPCEIGEGAGYWPFWLPHFLDIDPPGRAERKRHRILIIRKKEESEITAQVAKISSTLFPNLKNKLNQPGLWAACLIPM